ncbi:glycoside hydrolase family 38 C-terminal domain-containing protein [Clostridium isatidis]|uniref:glycoside hydrolase family 38 C-terminal domain-containing protein n=1 Tax=Clostridium isatidis TaxID=182773 RepID=UPI001A9A2EA2|nr:glycoside hydrolase family 38 C-terminal domain-containing protein [Clostridium isatidis]
MLINRIEPLYAIAESLGIDISKNLINTAWKKVLEGQAHDGMGGCITDNVAEDVLYRMKQAREICEAVENLIKRKIAEGIGLKENEVIVFNTLPYEFKGYKIVEFMSKDENVYLKDTDDFRILSVKHFEGKKDMLIEEAEGNYYINEDPYVKVTALAKISLPAMGYKVFEIAEGEVQKAFIDEKLEISNETYKIYIVDNKICLKLKNGKVVEDFIFFEDCGNDGDTYDFSELRNDKPIYFRVTEGIKEINGPQEKLILSGRKLLPKNLEARITKKELENLDLKLEITLTRESELISCKIIVDNKIDSHRLRVGIKSDIYSKESIASVPFGYIKRPIFNGNLSKDWPRKYVEIPIDIEVFESTAAITNEEYTLSVYSKGIKEYQVIDDILYLTLLSTTGELGKPNLLYRPGRASGDTTNKGHVMIPTPLAQQHGINEFEFAIVLEKASFDGKLIDKRYESYTAQNITYQMQTFNKFINRLDNKIQASAKNLPKFDREYSLLELDNNLVFSSLAPSLKDKAILLRLKNSTDKSMEVKIKDFRKFSNISIVNNIEVEQEGKDLIIKPYNMLTIKLWY